MMDDQTDNTPMSNQGSTTSAKADLAKRFVAVLIDGVIAGVLSFVPMVGGLVGAAYILLRDGFEFDFMDGRSLGKKLMKLRPVKNDGSKMTLEDSAKRNWPLMFSALVSVLLFIPVIGWILIPIVIIASVVISVIELVSVLNDSEGRRWGDKLANTKVIEVES
jgi:uncharacterized RDD family membrane protein YckC